MVGTERANAIERLERAGKESARTENQSTDDVIRFKSAYNYGIIYRTSNEPLTSAETLASVFSKLFHGGTSPS